jgi:hypothetical protein
MPLSPEVIEARINVRICQLRIIAAMTALRPDRHVGYVLDGEPVAWPSPRSPCLVCGGQGAFENWDRPRA